MIITKLDAIKSLVPSAEMVMKDEDIISWTGSERQPTEDEIAAEKTRLINAEPMRLLREERDRLLILTDWMSLEDSPTMSDSWKAYRQALRNLPSSSNPTVDTYGNLNMSSVNWPTPPS